MNESTDIISPLIDGLAEELAKIVPLIRGFMALGISETEIQDLIFDTIQEHAVDQNVANQVSQLIGEAISQIFRQSEL